jgi:hypothetical protein
MVRQSPRHESNPKELGELLVPPQPESISLPEASVTEKCDALLDFCERALQLQDDLLRNSSPRTDFTPYQTTLREIRATASEGSEADAAKTPEAVALNLMTLASAYLSTDLTHEQSIYWMRVTSALTAATRTTMPDLCELLIDTRSKLAVDRVHTPVKTWGLDEYDDTTIKHPQTSV